MADPRAEFNTVLGSDATFKGDLTFDSAAKVQGRVDGSIKSKGLVFIADGSDPEHVDRGVLGVGPAD